MSTVSGGIYLCSLLVVVVVLSLVAVSCARSGDLRDEGTPTPPLPPQVSIEYGGNVQKGRQGSYSWPIRNGYGGELLAEEWPADDFDKAPALVVKRGDDLGVIVLSGDPSQFEVRAYVYTVLRADDWLVWPGEEVYSSLAGKGITLDLPPDVYLLTIDYESQLGYIFYEFKVEVVN